MKWDFNDSQPIYSQIIDTITMSIVSGEYQAGQKLTSVRDLAAEASVNPNTMQKALSELERNGLVFSNRTSGRFITSDLELLDEIKINLATVQINQFIRNMNSLGFKNDETIELITDALST